MKTTIRYFAAALLLALAAGAGAQTVDLKALAAQMKQGGYVIVFRHGETNPDQADTDLQNYDNIARQRQLSGKGREEARQVGASFRKLGIPLGKVYTSKLYRAVETGKLVSGGEVTPSFDLTEGALGGMGLSPTEHDRRVAAFRKMAGTRPEAGKNTLIVTHKPNIIDAFGKDWFEVKEGEASVFKPDASGKAVLVARVQAADWIKAAGG